MFASLFLAAALAPAPDALMLHDAMLLARANGLGVRLQRQKLLNTLAERRVLATGAMPRVSIENAAAFNRLPPDSPLLAFSNTPGGGSMVGFPAPGFTVDTTLAVNQVVFDNWQLRDHLAIADRQEAIATLATEQAEQDAMLTAATAFFQVLRAEALAAVAQQVVTQARDHLALGNTRLAAGSGTRAEVLQLRARVAQAQGELIQAMNAVNVARLALGNALNAPVGRRPLQAAPAVPSIEPDTEAALAEALERRAEVRRGRLQVEVDQAREQVEGKATWPTVHGVTRYAQRGFNQGQFLAGANISWPLFDGFRTRERQAVLRGAAEADAIELEQARQAIALEVRRQDQNRQDAVARMATAREGLKAAEEAYRIARTRFREGLGSYMDLLDAQGTLTQARNVDVLAKDDQRVAELRLARALGRDLATGLVARPRG